MDTPGADDRFRQVLDGLTEAQRGRVAAVAPEAERRAADAAAHWDFTLPAQAVDIVLGKKGGDAVRRGLIAHWGLGVVERARDLDLPPQVLALYPFWLDKLADFLLAGAEPYDADFWAKDVRFALALSVPGARSQVIDLSSPFGPGQTVRHALQGRGLAAPLNWLRCKGWRPWLEVHTESRHLDDFNEEGWNRAWATAAAICERNPELAGMIGSSWFYDPPLTEISPRLAHLRLNPLRGGAFMVHQGPGEIHSERAAAASPTRKALIESGRYTPRSWLMAWPRDSLIAWARGREASA